MKIMNTPSDECAHDRVEPRRWNLLASAWRDDWPEEWKLDELGWCLDCEHLVARATSASWKTLPPLPPQV
jgi:hypothetical protein